MIVVEKVIGNLHHRHKNEENLSVDYVDVEWHETHKKIHKKVTASGEEVGMRFDDHILVHGLIQDDILYEQDGKVIAVNIPPCDALVIEVEDTHLIPKVCYEIGNKHAPFFRGENEHQFITPYDKPLEVLLEKLGACITHKAVKLDFTKAISTSLGGHHH
ncbi:MAG: urease accessory protein UreE [Cellulosilyticum sp.]|nr:urease accessory protein UreE [Cellulosilyticum sp.]